MSDCSRCKTPLKGYGKDAYYCAECDFPPKESPAYKAGRRLVQAWREASVIDPKGIARAGAKDYIRTLNTTLADKVLAERDFLKGAFNEFEALYGFTWALEAMTGDKQQ